MTLPRILKDRQFQIALALAGLFLVILFIYNLFLIGGDEFIISFNSSPDGPLAAMVFLACLLIWRRVSAEKQARRLWGGLLVGWGLWALAEFIWTAFVIIDRELPYPSWADLFWLVGYIPLGFGLIARAISLPHPSRWQNMVIWLATILLVIPVFYFVLLPILQGFDPERTMESALNLAYPLGDLFLAIVVVRLFLLYDKGSYGFVWRFLVIGFILMTLSDIAYAYASWFEIYYPDSRATFLSQYVIDIPYTLSYLLWLVGLYALHRLLREDRLVRLEGIVPVALPRYGNILVYTRADGTVINTSPNYARIFEGRLASDLTLGDALGISEDEAQQILSGLRRERTLANIPVHVRSPSGNVHLMHLYGLANRYPENEFSGGNLLLRFPVRDEGIDDGLDQYDRSMVAYLLEQCGSEHRMEVSRFLQSYHTAYLLVLLRLLEREGGATLAGVLLDHLQDIATRRNWSLRFDLRRGLDGGPYPLETVREAFPVILRAARQAAAEMVDPYAVSAQMRLVDEQLGDARRREAARYERPGSETGFI